MIEKLMPYIMRDRMLFERYLLHLRGAKYSRGISEEDALWEFALPIVFASEDEKLAREVAELVGSYKQYEPAVLDALGTIMTDSVLYSNGEHRVLRRVAYLYAAYRSGRSLEGLVSLTERLYSRAENEVLLELVRDRYEVLLSLLRLGDYYAARALHKHTLFLEGVVGLEIPQADKARACSIVNQ